MQVGLDLRETGAGQEALVHPEVEEILGETVAKETLEGLGWTVDLELPDKKEIEELMEGLELTGLLDCLVPRDEMVLLVPEV